MVSYGDVIIGLKEQKIYPSDKNYSDQIVRWFESNVNHIIAPKCTNASWLEKFSTTFKNLVKLKWKQTNNSIKFGYSDQLDTWLKKHIHFLKFHGINHNLFSKDHVSK